MKTTIFALGLGLGLCITSADAGWVELVDVDRGAAISFGDTYYSETNNTGGSFLSFLQETENNASILSEHDSGISDTGIDFYGKTRIATSGEGPDDDVYSHVWLNTLYNFDTEVVMELTWDFLLNGGSDFQLSAGIAVIPEGGGDASFDMSAFETQSGGSTIELNPGVYEVAIYIGADLASGFTGNGLARGSVDIFIDAVPAPGALGLMGTALLVGRRRRRR